MFWKLGNMTQAIFSDIPQFLTGIFGHLMHLNQSVASKNIWWIIKLIID